MRVLIQRVTRAEVRIGNNVEGRISAGIVALIGIASGDTSKDADYLADKLIHLRIFSDPQGKMNLRNLILKCLRLRLAKRMMLINQFLILLRQ